MIPLDDLRLFHYGAIHADPPWQFRLWSAAGARRGAQIHYGVMDLAAIKALPVGHLAAKDSALFMWATDPMLPWCIEVMEAWGFTYRTVAFNWAKLNPNAPDDAWTVDDFHVGGVYWTRANAEICLMGVNGQPKRKSKGVRRLIIEHRREHSRKPEAVYRRIEQLVDGPYLDLFSRQTRAGWDSWGAEAGKFDEVA